MNEGCGSRIITLDKTDKTLKKCPSVSANQMAKKYYEHFGKSKELLHKFKNAKKNINLFWEHFQKIWFPYYFTST